MKDGTRAYSISFPRGVAVPGEWGKRLESTLNKRFLYALVDLLAPLVCRGWCFKKQLYTSSIGFILGLFKYMSINSVRSALITGADHHTTKESS